MTAQRDDEKARPVEARPREPATLPAADPGAPTAVAPGPASSSRSFSEEETAVKPTSDSSARFVAAAFAPGQVLAERYEIVRFIAQGGMGEVYEARDLKLQGILALKTIRADVAARPRALDRFHREVHIARRVTHPNVCRIFDVDEHHWPAVLGSGPMRAPVTFLTMELLGGETLGDRLERGRIELGPAREIIGQIAAGLDAAHALGIVHRDFKSGNVMLVPQGSAPGGTRVVVTDFGLARGVEGESPLASISETGAVVGTPAYMAPEQVEGKPLTAAADLYAFGVVIYEMVTGQRPFTGSSAMNVAVKRLQGPPPSPREHVAGLDPVWEAAILRCLERDPADRFATAGDIVKALGGFEVAPASGVAALQRHRARRHRTLYAAAAVLVAGGGAWLWFSSGKGRATRQGAASAIPASPAARPHVTRRALALVGVSNATARPAAAWLATGLPEMLATELGAGEGLRLVPADEVVRARKELGLDDDLTKLSREALVRLGLNLGADLLGVGSYALVGTGSSAPIRLDFRVVSAASGDVVASSSSTGTETQVFDLVSRAGAALRQQLGLPEVSPAEALQVEASLPANREAARLYSEGLAHLRNADAIAARDALEKAVAAEPGHPLPHAALAQSWSALGYDGKAREEAHLAAASATPLPPEQRLLIEAGLHRAEKDWPRAVESYRRVAAEFPDNQDYGLLLAGALTSAGRGQEALATLGELRKAKGGQPRDPRIDLAEAEAQLSLGKNAEQRAAAARAAEEGAAHGMRLLEARARLVESVALMEMGESGPARAAADSARSLAEAAGDRSGTARALEQTARILERGGDLDGASRLYDRALETYRSLGALGRVARALEAKARLLRKRGSPRESEVLYTEALATFRRIGAKYEAAATLNDLGAKLQIEGNLAGAEKRYEEALSLFGEVGDKTGLAATLTNLGEVLFARGDLKQSQEMHQESLATNREIGDKAGQGYDLYRLGEVLSARGDLSVAREKYTEALGRLGEAGDRLTAAEAKLGLGRLELAQGRASAAEAIARSSDEVFRAEGALDRQAQAQVLLADALLAQKETAAAKGAAEQARTLAETSKERRARWGATRVAAEVRATGSAADRASAGAALDVAAVEAARAGYRGVDLELRLAAGRIEQAAGQTQAARARLSLVAREASALGFGLLAGRATALLR